MSFSKDTTDTGNATTNNTIDATLVLDRFLSASSSDDVYTAVTTLLRGLQRLEVTPKEIYTEIEVIHLFVSILQTSKYKNTAVAVDDCIPIIIRIYTLLLQQCNENSSVYKNGITTLLNEPTEGRLIEALVDIASPSTDSSDSTAVGTNTNTYSRVVAIQLMHTICKIRPKIAIQQLMNTPNGLHRLGDLLRLTEPEQVRNEALLLASTISDWPAAAKVWMFTEVGDFVISIAVHEDGQDGISGGGGGLTGGNVLVLDCLTILKNMLKHDASLADLAFESPVVAPSLAKLLDLRRGTHYRFPNQQKQLLDDGGTSSAPSLSKTASANNKSSNNDDSDDLDDLLGMGKKVKTTTTASTNDANETIAPVEKKNPSVIIPHLTEGEENVISAVFDILAIVLEHESVKRMVWKKHVPLSSLLWEMALLSPPPPGAPYPCAVPSITLQQRALQITALYFSNQQIMERHAGLDRLLYVVCTGGRGTTLTEKVLLQQSAIHVIRQTLPIEMLNQMLLHVLAPPTMDDVDLVDPNDPSMKSSKRPATAPSLVVQKLLNTAFENLLTPESEQNLIPKPASTARKVFLSGSLRGIELFLNDEASRSILFQITKATETSNPGDGSINRIPSLIDAILECLSGLTDRSTGVIDDDDSFLTIHLLRFLLSWMNQTTIVVQTILSSSFAPVLSTLYTNSKATNNTSVAVAALINCIVGICMEYMGDENLCGGWTRSSLMNMITSSKGGVGKFTSQIEKFKDANSQRHWWSLCTLEWNVWRSYYDSIVLVVRKRVVMELSSAIPVDDESEASDTDVAGTLTRSDTGTSTDSHTNSRVSTISFTSPSKSHKSLQRLLSQQSDEIDELRQQLSLSKVLNQSQEKQIATWKQRAESNPNQLDDMLDELTSKNVVLDEKVMSLEEEMRAVNEKRTTELAEHNDHIQNLSVQLEEFTKQQEEMRQDNDTLRDEMSSMSQAYQSLETEYRRQQVEYDALKSQQTAMPVSREAPELMVEKENGTQTTVTDGGTEDPTPEALAITQQHQPFTGSNEVSALRAENGRLQQQLKEADDWIALAVPRMSELDSHIATLYQNVESLQTEKANEIANVRAELQSTQSLLYQEKEIREQMEASNSKDVQENGPESKPQIESSITHDERLEEQEMAASADRHRLKILEDELNSQIEAESALKERCSALQTEVDSVRLEIETNLHQYHTALQQRDAMIAELQSRVQPIHTTSTSPEKVAESSESPKTEEETQYKAQCATLQNEMDTLRKEFQSILQPYQDAIQQRDSMITEYQNQLLNNSSGSDNDAKCSSLQMELDTMRQQFESTVQQYNNAIQARDVMITELQSVDKIPTENLLDEDIQKREQEIVELKQANDEAQTWINQAVEHHKLLTDAINKLTEDNNALQYQIGESSTQSQSHINTNVSTPEKEQDYLKLQAQVATLQSDLISAQNTISTISELNSGDRARELETEIERLTQFLKDRDENVHSLQMEVKRIRDESMDVSQNSSYELHESTEHLSLLNKELSKTLDIFAKVEGQIPTEIHDMKMALDHLKSEMATIMEQKTSMSTVLQLQEVVTNLESQLNDQETEHSAVVQEWEEAYNQLETEKNRFVEELLQITDERDTIRLNLEMCNQRVNEISKEFDTLSILQKETTDSYALASEKVRSLESQLEELDISMKEQEAQAVEAVELWQQSYAELEDKLNETLSLIGEIESKGRSLSIEDTPPKSDVDHTVNSVQATALEPQEHEIVDKTRVLEERIDELHEALRTQSEEAQEAISMWQNCSKESNAKANALEERISELNEALQAQCDEADEAINLWQQSYTELESKLSDALVRLESMSTSMADEDNQAELHETVAAWQNSYAQLSSQYKEISEEKEQHLKELLLLRNEVEQLELKSVNNIAVHSGERVSEDVNLKVVVKTLDKELSNVVSGAEEVVHMWQSRCRQLEQQIKALEQSELSSISAPVKHEAVDSHDNGRIHDTRNELVDKLTTQVRELEDKQKQNTEYFTKRVEESQTSYLELDRVYKEESNRRIEELKTIWTTLNCQAFNELVAITFTAMDETVKTDIAAKCANTQDATLLLESIEARLKLLANKSTLILDDHRLLVAKLQHSIHQHSHPEVRNSTIDLERQKNVLLQKVEAGQEQMAEMQVNHKSVVTELKNRITALVEENDEMLMSLKDSQDVYQIEIQKSEQRQDEVKYQLAEMEQDRVQLVSHISELEEANAASKKQDETIQELQQQIADLTEDADEAIGLWKVTCNELEHQIETLLDEKKRSEELEKSHNDAFRVQFLEEQLRENTEYYNSLVAQWQTSYNALEEKLGEKHEGPEAILVDCLRDSLKSLMNDINTLELQLPSDISVATDSVTDIVRLIQESVKFIVDHYLLVTKDRGLHGPASITRDCDETPFRIQPQVHESSVKEASYEATIQELRNKNSFLESEIGKLKTALATEEEEINFAHKTRSPTIGESDENNNISDYAQALENQLVDERKEAEKVVEDWRKSYEALLVECEELTASNEVLQTELSERIAENQVGDNSRLQAESDAMIERIDIANKENDSLKEKIQKLEGRVSSHMEKSHKLEIDMESMNDSKNEMEQNLQKALSNIADLEATIHDLEKVNDYKMQAENRCLFLEQKIVETENSFISRLETITSEKDRQIDYLEGSYRESVESSKKAEADLQEARTEIYQLQQEIERLEGRALRLVQELREANATMKVFVTNGLNEKAAQTAAEALKTQVDDLCNQVQILEESLTTEQTAREKLEKANDALCIDLAALVGMEYTETNKLEIQNKVIVATENLFRRERKEVEALKTSLSEAMTHLNLSRTMQQKLEDEVAKARHQAAIYEQQVVASKNEFSFLTNSIDEMQQSEASRRASYEYRIETLQNEVKVQRLRQYTELENLKNELHQVSIERDKYLQSLKESEQRRENILTVTTMPSDETSLENELRRLQLEKSHLLTLAGDESSRVERRLREARTAQKSSLEADVIIERELRMAAEISLEDVRKEMRELAQKVPGKNTRSVSSSEMDQLQKDHDQAIEQLQLRDKEIEAIRNRLDTTLQESRVTINRLQHEVQQAQARVIHIEREGHFEAEVRAEQARLRAWQGTTSPQRVHMHSSSNEEKKEDASVSKLYDFIKRQTEAIEEEREVYMELAKKNEQLLALIAQLDILQKSMKRAIVSNSGQDMLEFVLRDAEKRVKMEFGQEVKFA